MKPADSQHHEEDTISTKRGKYSNSDEETSPEPSIEGRYSLPSVSSSGIPDADHSNLAMVPVDSPPKDPPHSAPASSNTPFLSQTAKSGVISTCLSIFFSCSCFSAQKQPSSHHREYDAVKQKAGGP